MTKKTKLGRGRPVTKRGLKMRELLKSGETPGRIAKKLGVALSYVYKVRAGSVRKKAAKTLKRYASIEAQFKTLLGGGSVRGAFTREVGR